MSTRALGAPHHCGWNPPSPALVQAVAAADAEDKLGRGQIPAYDAGMHGGWQAVGPCHKQRFLRYAPGEADGAQDGQAGAAAAKAGALLAQIRHELFCSAAFARLVAKVCWVGGTPTAVSLAMTRRSERTGVPLSLPLCSSPALLVSGRPLPPPP